MTRAEDYYRRYELDYTITLKDAMDILNKYLELPCIRNVAIEGKHICLQGNHGRCKVFVHGNQVRIGGADTAGWDSARFIIAAGILPGLILLLLSKTILRQWIEEQESVRFKIRTVLQQYAKEYANVATAAPVASVEPAVSDATADAEPITSVVPRTGSFCTQCGTMLAKEGAFCSNCGSKN